jgi:hypothetical protein
MESQVEPAQPKLFSSKVTRTSLLIIYTSCSFWVWNLHPSYILVTSRFLQLMAVTSDRLEERVIRAPFSTFQVF